MDRTVLFLRSKSPAGIEPRIDKEARTLSRAGYAVHVLLWDRGLEHPAREERGGYTIHRFRYRAPYGRASLLWKLPRWWFAAYRFIGKLRPQIVHAVDFDSLLPATWRRRQRGHRLVYDVFDFYGDMIARDVPGWVRNRISRMEDRGLARADLVILPDMARTSRLRVRPRKVVEVMNVPEPRPMPPRREAPDFVVFYGGMIARDRGLLDLVAACEAARAKLIFAGHGPDEAELLPLLESSPVAHFLGHVPYEDVLDRTANADLVAALYDPAVPNNRLASPNKLFEAMMFAKPVLVSDGSLMADFVRTHDLGRVVPYGDRRAIREALEELMLSPESCDDYGRRGRSLFESSYNWTVMERRLLDAYAEL